MNNMEEMNDMDVEELQSLFPQKKNISDQIINELKNEIDELKRENNGLRWELLDAQYDANRVSRMYLETYEAASIFMPVINRKKRGKFTYDASTKEAIFERFKTKDTPRVRNGYPQAIKGNAVRFDSIYPAASTNGEKIAIHLHLYYVDLLDEFLEYFKNIPFVFDLYVSCQETADTQSICKSFAGLEMVQTIIVRTTQNRGRDIAPALVLFGKEISEHDIFMHVHSKKSLFTGKEQMEWRTSALKELCGSEMQVKKIFAILQSDRKVGLYIPETVSTMPIFAHNWLQNKSKAIELSGEFDFKYKDSLFNYPVGSFFWARTDAVRPLFDRNYSYNDFDEENGQTDGTLSHAIERAFAKIAESRGFILAIGDSQEGVVRFSKSNKLYNQYLSYNVESAKKYLGEFDIVSFDIFDTLITRKILNPDDLFEIMTERIEKEFHISVDFLKIRKDAENAAWSKKGANTNIDDIYDELPNVSDISEEIAESIKKMEITLEYDLCIPRYDVREIYEYLRRNVKKIYLVSDMYLTSEIIDRMLKKCGYDDYDEMIISCEAGLRKDDKSLWKKLAEEWKGLRIIHVGDNLCSDAQLPGDYGINVYPVLSGKMLFELSELDDFIDISDSKSIAHSYVLGGIINQYIFNSPFALNEKIKLSDVDNTSISKAMFASLFISFLQAIPQYIDMDQQILFLSREGYLLKKMYEIYYEDHSEKMSPNEYFLASRRALSVADIKSRGDVIDILKEEYTGSLANLLETRLGMESKPEYYFINIKMPDQIDAVMKIIENKTEDYLISCNNQRQNYLAYANDIIKDSSRRPVVIDLGYSGTIQYHLAKLLSEKIDGFYLLTGLNSKPEKIECKCEGLFTKGKDVDSDNLSKFTLYLESILQAPYGQLMYFEKDDSNGVRAVYGEKDDCSSQIFLMQDAIIDYIRDFKSFEDYIGCDLKVDPIIASKLFVAFAKSGVLPEEFTRIFSVEDNYYGNGVKHVDNNSGEWIAQG